MAKLYAALINRFSFVISYNTRQCFFLRLAFIIDTTDIGEDEAHSYRSFSQIASVPHAGPVAYDDVTSSPLGGVVATTSLLKISRNLNFYI